MTEPLTEVSTAVVVHSDEIGMDRLQRAPIIDRIDQRQLELIKKTLAVSENAHDPITNAELGHFLELAAHYGLDPFAREVWIAKSKTGKLLIMVGRMGLRKIVDRNGLKMKSAAIYAKDSYMVEHIDNPADAKEGEWDAHGRQPFHRVTHKQNGIGEEARGRVVGAWARVVRRSDSVEVGWFDAPLSEYMPANVSAYSPWAKQVSAMIRGAVERQAGQEATTLGGLLVEGEDESARAGQTVGAGGGEMPEWADDFDPKQRAKIQELMIIARQVGHAGYSNEGTIRMRLNGQTWSVVEQWIGEACTVLDEMAETAKQAEKGEPADDGPLTLTFGGETFTFNDTDDPYSMIASAAGTNDMRQVAGDLEAIGLSLPAEMVDDRAWYQSMSDALKREADGHGE